MLNELRELWRFRELLISMVQRELRVRYKNSALGLLWSLINPLVTTAVMWVVFGKLLNNDIPSFFAYVLAAYLPYMFFQFSIMDSAQSVLASLPIVKKVYFPREILPIAGIISNFIHFLLGLAVLFVVLLGIYGRSLIVDNQAVFPIQPTVWLLPFLLLVSLMLATGVGLIVSALNTFYEDVKYIAGVGLYLLFFLCPIMYFVEAVANSSINLNSGGLVYKIYMSNPMAVLCIAYRKALLAPTQVPVPGRVVRTDAYPMPWNYLAYTTLLSAFLLVFGYWLFNRMKWRFVERP